MPVLVLLALVALAWSTTPRTSDLEGQWEAAGLRGAVLGGRVDGDRLVHQPGLVEEHDVLGDRPDGLSDLAARKHDRHRDAELALGRDQGVRVGEVGGAIRAPVEPGLKRGRDSCLSRSRHGSSL